MANDDLNKLLKGFKELIEVIKHKVDHIETNQTIYSAQLILIKEKQSVINDKLDDVNDKLDDPDTGLKRVNDRLDAVFSSVVEIESSLEGYADAYKTNKANIERLDERLSKIEDDSDVIVPPELAIQR